MVEFSVQLKMIFLKQLKALNHFRCTFQPTWNTLKQELISTLMPIFLGNHANSAVVLHYAWHCQGHSSTIRTLIMHSMAEWYMRGEQHDQIRLSRILDVAQDLKVWIYMKKSKFLNYRNFFLSFHFKTLFEYRCFNHFVFLYRHYQCCWMLPHLPLWLTWLVWHPEGNI